MLGRAGEGEGGVKGRGDVCFMGVVCGIAYMGMFYVACGRACSAKEPYESDTTYVYIIHVYIL